MAHLRLGQRAGRRVSGAVAGDSSVSGELRVLREIRSLLCRDDRATALAMIGLMEAGK